MSIALESLLNPASIVADSTTNPVITPRTSAAIDTFYAITLKGNFNLSFSASNVGRLQTVMILFTQDTTGSRLVTWPSNCLFAGGSAPTLTTTAGKRDMIRCQTYDGTNWYITSYAKNL